MKLILTFLFALLLTVIKGQKTKLPSTSELVMECMRSSTEGTNKQLVIWYPDIYWDIVGTQMKSSPEVIENIVTEMKNYIMFSVVDYTTTSSGFNFKSDEEIRKSIKLTDSSNNISMPLADSDITTGAKTLLENLQPIMAKTLGQLGEGMRLYLFKTQKVNGQPLLNVMTKNNFTLSWNRTSLNWRLPLSSVLPSKFCPVDNEKMKGNWNYCPLHGVKIDK